MMNRRTRTAPSPPSLTARQRQCGNFSLVFLLLTNLLCFQLGTNQQAFWLATTRNDDDTSTIVEQQQLLVIQQQINQLRELTHSYTLNERLSPINGSNVTENASSSSSSHLDPSVVASRLLGIPKGNAVALPSVRVDEESTKREGTFTIYGGVGDLKHLGGFTDIDVHGLCPETWLYMVQTIGVKSVLDVGCGRGISTMWFLMHGLNALCVEGSHDAFAQSVLSNKETQMVEHDFSRGPWWPNQTYDAVWCVEFLEHVGRQFHQHYMPAFRKAALVFATHSNWGGWHHVEVHKDEWWITKFQMYGLVYSESLTKVIRKTAKNEYQRYDSPKPGERYNPQHVWLNMLVFINPAVAVLPQHAHLMAEPGCYKGRAGKGESSELILRPCNTGKNRGRETPLPASFEPIRIKTPHKQRREWEDYIRKHLKGGTQKKEEE